MRNMHHECLQRYHSTPGEAAAWENVNALGKTQVYEWKTEIKTNDLESD